MPDRPEPLSSGDIRDTDAALLREASQPWFTGHVGALARTVRELQDEAPKRFSRRMARVRVAARTGTASGAAAALRASQRAPAQNDAIEGVGPGSPGSDGGQSRATPRPTADGRALSHLDGSQRAPASVPEPVAWRVDPAEGDPGEEPPWYYETERTAIAIARAVVGRRVVPLYAGAPPPERAENAQEQPQSDGERRRLLDLLWDVDRCVLALAKASTSRTTSRRVMDHGKWEIREARERYDAALAAMHREIVAGPPSPAPDPAHLPASPEQRAELIAWAEERADYYKASAPTAERYQQIAGILRDGYPLRAAPEPYTKQRQQLEHAIGGLRLALGCVEQASDDLKKGAGQDAIDAAYQKGFEEGSEADVLEKRARAATPAETNDDRR